MIIGCLDMLVPSKTVMADRWFLVEAEVLMHGCKLHIPAFLTVSWAQLTVAEVSQTRRIARARIYIERAIQRIKVFGILKFLRPSLLCISELIFKVCAFVTNFQKPVIADLVGLWIGNNFFQSSQEHLLICNDASRWCNFSSHFLL